MPYLSDIIMQQGAESCIGCKFCLYVWHRPPTPFEHRKRLPSEEDVPHLEWSSHLSMIEHVWDTFRQLIVGRHPLSSCFPELRMALT
ncbi:hypothetical protein AVEN_245265-1 [Araneus ventricosus]|uniref:Uncharacterized protein n=1 Tax=Araneus ventricosus TaxID=182803 RepID=A0A4Y2ECA3_ARAVE|nr:hypothetical protein AVEN_245265-1 [Araneus ventricosus]